ncbi:MAG: flagellar protein [Spirochaetes bacterium]|nr:MAG: flagellar protein [Spirochaetota bacterium]
MVTLHKLSGEEFMLNENLIETLEARPDTVVTLLNERKYLVKESVAEIAGIIAGYQRSVFGAGKK